MATQTENTVDPTKNVRELVEASIKRLDDIHCKDVKRLDEKIDLKDVQYQLQFASAREAVGIASTAQEKLVAQALDGTRDAINKADLTTDKRFSLLSEKIDGVTTAMNKSTGERGIYVTHSDLQLFGEKIQSSFENALKPLISQVTILTAVQNSQQGTGEGRKEMYGWIVGGVMFLIAVASFFIKVTPN